MEDKNKDWRTAVSKNLVELVSRTPIHTEMVLHLFLHKLITPSELDLLSNHKKPHFERAAYLYTNIARKWDESEFESFKLSLREGGNARVLAILTDEIRHVSSRVSNDPQPVKDSKEEETQNTPVLPLETPKDISNSVILPVDSKEQPSHVQQVSSVHLTNDELLKMEQLEAMVVQYVSIGRYDIAAPLCEQAIEDLERDYNPNHLGVAALLDILASVYKNQIHEEKEAKNVLKYALPNKNRTKEVIKGNFGQKTIHYRDVEALYKRALQIRKHVHDDDHPDVAASLENLAGYYAEQTKFKDAEPLYEEALEIKTKALGDSPDVAISLINLATVYKQLKKYEEAETDYKRAFEIYKKGFGNDHPLVATCLNYLGLLYAEQGIYVDTVHIFNRALEIRREKLGNDHLDVAEVLNNLASAYKERTKYEHAESFFKEAIKIREASLLPDHPDLAASLIGLADLYAMQEKYSLAENLYKRSLEIRKKYLGEKDPQVASLLDSLEDIYKIQGKYKDHQEANSLLTNLPSLQQYQGKQEDTKQKFTKGKENRQKPLQTSNSKVRLLFECPRNLMMVLPIPLNEGSFGAVYKYKHILTDSAYAIKKIGIHQFEEKFRRKGVEKILLEVQKLSNCRHPRVVKYHAHWFEGPHANILREFESSPSSILPSLMHITDELTMPVDSGSAKPPMNFLCIQMGFCELTLDDWLNDRKTPDKRDIEEIYHIFYQIIEGLAYIHNEKIIHRDIKPKNILMKPLPATSNRKVQWDVKLGDFGFACDNITDKAKSIKGTSCYMSLEIRTGIYDTPADIFAAGVTFLETLIVMTPKIWDELYTETMFSGHFPGLISELSNMQNRKEMRIISALTSVDPRSRPDAKSILRTLQKHPTEVKSAEFDAQSSWISNQKQIENAVDQQPRDESIKLIQSLNVGETLTADHLKAWYQLGNPLSPVVRRVTKEDVVVPRKFANLPRIVLYRKIVHQSPQLSSAGDTFMYEVKLPNYCFVCGAAAIDITMDTLSPDIHIKTLNHSDHIEYLFNVKPQPLKGYSLVLLLIGYNE